MDLNASARKNSSKRQASAQNVTIMMHVLNVLAKQSVKSVIKPIIGYRSQWIKYVNVTEHIMRMTKINVCYVELRDVISARHQILVNLVQRKKDLNLMLLRIHVPVREVSI